MLGQGLSSDTFFILDARLGLSPDTFFILDAWSGAVIRYIFYS